MRFPLALAKLLILAALTGASAQTPPAVDPIILRDMGSFHVGGREVEVTGKPVKEVTLTPGGVPVKVDPNGTYVVEAMYAQYFLPTPRRGAWPLLMWHGGGLTGVTYESTPDGRPGWWQYFVRKGWDTYVSDAVERGRSGWAMTPDIFKGDPVFLTKDNPYERFRIGPGAGSYAKKTTLPGVQFPVEAYDAFMKQIVPRWTTTDAAILKAYEALLDKVGPSVVLVHSQAGTFGWKAAQSRPDKVKALILVEPAGVGEVEAVAAVKDIPVLVLYGDFIDQDARWPKIRANGLAFYEKVRAAGGVVEVIDLPKAGVAGNSHLVMMDRNNLVVADVIQDWLSRKGLWK